MCKKERKKKTSPKYRMVIFDFDGTLADTKESIIKAYQKTFKELNLPKVEDSELEKWIGLGAGTILEKTLKLKNKELEKTIEVFRKNYDEIAFQGAKLFPKVKETLTKLKQKGVKLVIVSSKGESSLKKLLSKLEINHFFSLVIGDESLKIKKPSPYIINQILKRQNLKPKEVLIVGDRIYDIQMGKNAHCKSCFVSYGYGDPNEIKKSSADYVIEKISDLLRIVF